MIWFSCSALLRFTCSFSSIWIFVEKYALILFSCSFRSNWIFVGKHLCGLPLLCTDYILISCYFHERNWNWVWTVLKKYLHIWTDCYAPILISCGFKRWVWFFLICFENQRGMWVWMCWKSIWRRRSSLGLRTSVLRSYTFIPAFKGAKISPESPPFDQSMTQFRPPSRLISKPCISFTLTSRPDSSSQLSAASSSLASTIF